MQSLDWTGPSVPMAYGLWFLLFPASVQKFYTWFLGRYHNPRPIPTTVVIRVIGAAWLVLVAVVFWVAA